MRGALTYTPYHAYNRGQVGLCDDPGAWDGGGVEGMLRREGIYVYT